MEDYMEISNDTETKKMVVTDKMKADFLTSCKWVKVLIIINLIGYIIFLITVNTIVGVSVYEYTQGDGLSDKIWYIINAYVFIFIMIGLYPLIKFWKFASSTRVAIRNTDTVKLDKAILSAKKAVKFVGVLTILVTIIISALMVYLVADFFA